MLERKDLLKTLLDLPSGAVPLLDSEKARLEEEYVTLLLNTETTSSELKGENIQNPRKFTQTELWYQLLTKKSSTRTAKT